MTVQARALTRRYGDGAGAVQALRGVDIDVRAHELVAIMGPSGSGKSTLMHILAGLDKPTSGTVTVAGTELSALDDTKLTRLRREHIGFVFQFFNLLPMLSAEENVVLPLTIAGERPDRAWLEELLGKMGLDGRRGHRPSEALSGGEQQRVAIARALVSRPTILFADEPTGNLDSKTGGEILQLMRDSVQSYGQTTVMVTHEPRAASIADRILFLGDGLIVKEFVGASAADVLAVMSEFRVIGVALKGLASRKLRATLTALAIVLGVAMVSGTYILTDTIKSAFGTVFTQVYKHTDAVITGKSAIAGEEEHNGRSTPAFSEALLARVRTLPGVAEAQGGVSDSAQLIGRDGKVISGGGSSALAFSVHPQGDQRFNPLELVSGSWPAGPEEVAIDANTAKRKHYAVGQTIGVIARGPEQRLRIAGIAKIGGVTSLGGATMAIFDFPVAQKLFDKQGKLDTISIAAKSGVAATALVREIRPLLPPNAQVRTGEGQAKQATKDTNGFLSIIQDFLLAFGGVALFVGSFVIANTISITIAQRTRELATLRTLGASRRQVLRSVMLEAFVIGLLAAVAGLFLGLGLAKGLNSLFVSFGIDLPQAGTVFATRTIIVSLLVGVLITLLAALRPALRATRVPPISAVREGSVLPPGRFARFGPYVAGLAIAGSLALMLIGLFVSSLSTTQRLLAIGIGAAGMFVGVAMLAKTLVPPLAAVLGWPAARIGGAAGSLARGNSMRNPTRTASTASALMIALALVTLVSVLAAGLKSTFDSAVNQVFKADYALTATNNFSPISTASANALRGLPGVQVVADVRAGSGRAFGSKINVSGVEGGVSRVIKVKWQAGSQAVPGELAWSGAFVSKAYAKAQHLRVGSPIAVETPTGATMHLILRGIFAPPKGGTPYGDVTISTSRFDAEYQNPQNVYAFVDMAGGVTAANTSTLKNVLASFPDAKIATEQEFKNNQEQGINTLLNLLYVLLSLSIIVSLFGIVNTLVLTVFERTRELGMLRAVGMTRRQLRRMIRHESIVTALIGAALGIPVGILLALMVGQAIEYPAFTIPVGTLVVFIIAAIIAGVLAAVFPARRAARLNVLEALAYE